ncbi:MAG: leucyl aminopeptidase [Gammaproteobacteria bacterium]|nr:leucyl aminopeptidase [Gammaproteobacteria bacterium]
MEYNIKSGSPEKQRSACVLAGVHETRKLTPAAQALDEAGAGFLSGLLRKGDMDGKIGQSLLLHNVPGCAAERLLLLGCGKQADLDDRQYRKIITASVKQLRQTGATEAMSFLPELDVKARDYHWKIQNAVQWIDHELYRFNEFKSKKSEPKKGLHKITLVVPTRRELAQCNTALTRGMALAAGVKLTRDLANRPANTCTPTHLAEQALALGKTYPAVDVSVLDEAEMKELGMHSLLSVSQGSAQPGKLIVFRYQGAGDDSKPVALIGKGVTFDTGGISIKPSAAMDEMKFDMCGAASVFGAVAAVAGMELPINLVGLTPAVENMPSSTATKPGDIFTSMSGQTVEVLNTDAEGRLILCDALTYSERFEPAAVVDIATLTGACIVALGKHASGLMSNHEPLAAELLRAGLNAGDRAWQLPLWEEYEKQLDSPFADMANIGGREAGTITAACFLSKFARKFHWAHLDIAGTAWVSGKNKCATGRPVPLLVEYLIQQCEKNT